MAKHIRNQLRESVATTLTGLSTTGSNVSQSRIFNLEESGLPALVIYTKSEASELLVMGSARELQRDLTLAVEIYVKGILNVDDTIDNITKEVEEAMATDVTHGGLARDTFLESTEIEFNGEGDVPLAVCTMNYILKYHTAENDVDAAV